VLLFWKEHNTRRRRERKRRRRKEKVTKLHTRVVTEVTFY
jgi:hypothetical protein